MTKINDIYSQSPGAAEVPVQTVHSTRPRAVFALSAVAERASQLQVFKPFLHKASRFSRPALSITTT
ncbi:hypothetical protein DERF_012977 [Dermatophagoides farinae]|nr:hypothetical protein DERF_012977 [Dermatophagoides farinae]